MTTTMITGFVQMPATPVTTNTTTRLAREVYAEVQQVLACTYGDYTFDGRIYERIERPAWSKLGRGRQQEWRAVVEMLYAGGLLAARDLLLQVAVGGWAMATKKDQRLMVRALIDVVNAESSDPAVVGRLKMTLTEAVAKTRRADRTAGRPVADALYRAVRKTRGYAAGMGESW